MGVHKDPVKLVIIACSESELFYELCVLPGANCLGESAELLNVEAIGAF